MNDETITRPDRSGKLRIERVCVRCSGVFHVCPSRSTARFCSSRCSNGGKSIARIRCGACHTMFEVPKRRAATAQYCSWSCSGVGRTGKKCSLVQRPCAVCGIPFTAWPYRTNARCCSKQCAATARRTGIPVLSRNCEQCGTLFEVETSKVRFGKGRNGRFCSRRCCTRFAGAARRIEPVKRFWLKVDKNGPVQPHCPELGPCWVWTGGIERTGYGKFAISSRRGISAHRASWQFQHGDIPDGMQVLHACDNRACVRHLFLGTHLDNMRDCSTKGRHSHGQSSHASKLTEDTVRMIRGSSEGYLKMAARLGVSGSTVYAIRKRKTWAHVE